MDTYEQKYKEALEKAKESYYRFEGKTVHYDLVKLDLEDMFPELKEREDERIRKALIENFKFFGGDRLETSKWGRDDGLLVTNILAWLEKQGEEARNIALRTEYEKGRADAIAEMQKPAWSEDDEVILGDIICSVNASDAFSGTIPLSLAKHEKKISWLKSLKSRVQPQLKQEWKPSDEQMKVLNEVVNFSAQSSSMRWNDYNYGVLKGLRDQLKKLKEE